MKRKKCSSRALLPRLMFTALFSLAAMVAFAQGLTLTGIVLDETGGPVAGANIAVVGTTNGVITDMDGKFELSGVADNARIRVSYIGYVTQEIPVSGRTHVQIQLEEDTRALEEVVVIGYGVQKKSDVTGAVAVVSSKDLTMKPASNALEALQGKAAGVDITSNQRPGELGTVRVRGVRSITASNSPLYVVDGVVLSAGGIETLNPRDIESINVLKDASSTAIYGSRGANGVILVTTKRGKTGAFNLNYAGTVTFENIRDLQPSMNAEEYITWRRWAYHNATPDSFSPGNQPSREQDMTVFNSSDPTALNNVLKGWAGGAWDPSKVTDTNWTDLVSQTGLSQEHTFSASGGTETLKSFLSIGYLNNEGTQKGQSYERYNLTASVDITPTRWLVMGGSVNTAWSNQKYGYSRTGQSTNSGPTEIYNAAKAIPNWTMPYDENGLIVNTPGGINGVYTVIDEWKKSNDDRQALRLLGNVYTNVNIGEICSPLEGLNYKVSFGSDMRYFRQGIYLDQSSAVRGGGTSYARWDYNRRFSWVLDNIISYNKTLLDIHAFDVTLLHSASQNNTESARMSEENVPKSSYKWNNMGAVSVTDASAKVSISTGLTESSLVSYGYRLNYSLMEKYLLTVSGRYDGASMLAEGNKWAFFPSAALGWRMEQESFLNDVDWLQQLKLRVGVGMTGNAAIDPYSTLGNIRSNYAPFGGQSDVLFYVPNEPYYWSDNVRMANPKLGWEKTTQWNFAVDFSVLKGRINGSVDVYTSRTNDLIMDMNIPTITGYSTTLANVGKTKNKGIDISLQFIPVDTRNFTWFSGFNTAWQKEEIVELAYGKNDMVFNSLFIGQPISVYYGYESDGLWQDSDAGEMAKFNENGEKFTPGMVKPVDQDGDYTMTEEDRVILGNRSPKWTLGWSNTLRYGDIELNVELNGRMGYMISTGGEAQGAVSNQRKIDYWRPDNTNADYQKPIYTGTPGTSLDTYSSLIGFKKASYVKVRNISLGYYLPGKVCSKLGINNLKVYGQLRNLGNIYSSIDFLDLDMGEAVSFYNRGMTLGLEISF
ncbi:MAG: TonB-dependent receptor [Tannerella sp.]|nr:TonB-dependent receptor [Tannerella sp.]